MNHRFAWDGRGAIRYVRRGGVWKPVTRLSSVLADWTPTGVVAGALLASAYPIGLYSARPDLDAESRAYAQAAAKAAVFRQGAAPLLQDLHRAGSLRFRGCHGGAVIAPLSISQPVRARYYCEVAGKQASYLVVVSLIYDQGAWSVSNMVAEAYAAAGAATRGDVTASS